MFKSPFYYAMVGWAAAWMILCAMAGSVLAYVYAVGGFVLYLCGRALYRYETRYTKLVNEIAHENKAD